MFIPVPGSEVFHHGFEFFYPGFEVFHPGFEFFLSRISGQKYPGSESASKNLSEVFKKKKKMFPSSRKYDPGCSSRIPDPDFFPILYP